MIGLTKRLEDLEPKASVTGSVLPPTPTSKPPRTPAKTKGGADSQSLVPQRGTTTWVPTFTRSNRSVMSSFNMRMQP